MMQTFANLERLDPAGVGALTMPLIEAQVAEAFKCARQADLVVVAPSDSQRTIIECARAIELMQRARGIAQMQQRDSLAARVLKLFLQCQRLFVRCLRLFVMAGTLVDRANHTVRARLADDILDALAQS